MFWKDSANLYLIALSSRLSRHKRWLKNSDRFKTLTKVSYGA